MLEMTVSGVLPGEGIEMYKLVIADDEIIIREGLMDLVDWNSLGFEIVESFSDGQEIIEYLEYVLPDVILTDIKMSHVSGLEVARYVFEHQLPCKVVLISGYQEFRLAVQGIKYGAEDYLLKPTNVDHIRDTFIKIRDQLDSLKMEQEKEQAQKERMEEAIPLLEEHFFADLVMGVVDSEEYIRSRIGVLYPEINAQDSPCILADIYIEDFSKYMEEIWEYSYDQLEVNLTNFLRIYKGEYLFHIVYKAENMIEVLGIRTQGAGGGEEAGGRQAMDGLVQELSQNFRFRAVYEIRRRYDTIFEIGRLKEDAWERTGDTAELDQRLMEQKKLIMSNITIGNIVTAQKLFHNILKELEPLSAVSRNNAVIEILATMNDVIKEVNEKLSQSLQSYFNYGRILSAARTDEVRGYCDRIFDRIKVAEEKKEYYDANSLVNKAKSYIQENISRDISQEEIANQLYICSSYLRRLFKKQTGESFTQYVTRIKVEKAIELLKDSKYKTYQVSEMVGYKTPRYFSRMFRMQTGMNPSEYRGKVLHVGGEFDEN